MTTTNEPAGIDLDMDNLEALARAATPGPWLWWTSNSYMRLSARGDGDVMHGERLYDGVCTVNIKRADAAFTEALDPATVLALIDLARRAPAPIVAHDAPASIDLDKPLTDDEIFAAYDEGQTAAERGGKASECPYPHGSQKHDRWMLGFEDNGGA